VAAANRHLTEPMELEIRIPGYPVPDVARATVLAYPDITARTTPAEPRRFPVAERSLKSKVGVLTLTLMPSSVTWMRV
jgi:hypothetical protein